jgi:hypothetical protein
MIAVAFVFDPVLAHELGLTKAAFHQVVDDVGPEQRKSPRPSEASTLMDPGLDAASPGASKTECAVATAFASVFGSDTDAPALVARYRQTVIDIAPDFIRPTGRGVRTLR